MATTNSRLYRVQVEGADRDVRKFLRVHPLETTGVEIRDGRIRFEAYVDERQRETLLSLHLTIEAQFDVYENLLRRRAQIGPKDRFLRGGIPEGIGRLVR